MACGNRDYAAMTHWLCASAVLLVMTVTFKSQAQLILVRQRSNAAMRVRQLAFSCCGRCHPSSVNSVHNAHAEAARFLNSLLRRAAFL